MALTQTEKAYFDIVLAKIKYSVNVTIPIIPMDHNTVKGHKEALGMCWYNGSDKQNMQAYQITIDEFFIQECYAALEKPYLKIEPKSLEEVIAHEIAHIKYWRHGKKHTEHTQYIMKLIESGKSHGIKNTTL